MICPRCNREIRISPHDYSSLAAHLADLANAFEDRGDSLEAQLVDARSPLDRMHDANRAMGHKLKLANDRAKDLQAQLQEFKTARRGTVAVTRKLRRSA